MPGGNAKLGRLASNTWNDTSNYGVRAREELKLTPKLTAVAGIGWEATHLKGINSTYNTVKVPIPTIMPRTADRQFQNTAPELALLYKPNQRMAVPGACRHRRRHAVDRKPVRPVGRSAGNNTQLQTQKNLGYDWASTGLQTKRSSSVRPDSMNSSATNWYVRRRGDRGQLYVQRATVGASRGRAGR